MGVLPALNMSRQYTTSFWTIEAPPSGTKEVYADGKAKIATILKAAGWLKIIVVHECSADGYHHYHAVAQAGKPLRVLRLQQKLQRDMWYQKKNGSKVSVRAFGPRAGHEGWADLRSYVVDKKYKITENCDQDYLEIVVAVFDSAKLYLMEKVIPTQDDFIKALCTDQSVCNIKNDLTFYGAYIRLGRVDRIEFKKRYGCYWDMSGGGVRLGERIGPNASEKDPGDS